MPKPKEGEIWIVTTERIDQETKLQLPAEDLTVEIELIEAAHIRKSVDRETGKEFDLAIPDRVHFRYQGDEKNKTFGVAGLLGTYELAMFQRKGRRT